MKKLVFLLFITTIIACNKNENKEEQKNNTVLWGENILSKSILDRDTMAWDEKEWNDTYKYDKEKIFSSVVNAVRTGKLKAYNSANEEMSIENFNSCISIWDSTYQVEDPKNPGTMISSPLHRIVTGQDLVEMRMNEKMEFDTISCTLNKKVSFIRFLEYKYSVDGGENLGLRFLFDVKLNDNSPIEKKE